MENDDIKNPKHYTQGIECWDYIISHKMNYLEGNIVKYITRWRHKDGLKDLKKAQAFLEKLIEIEKELIVPTSNTLCQYWNRGHCTLSSDVGNTCHYRINGVCHDRN